MHNNFYFLRQLSLQLKHELIGYKIGEIFSQAKNELVIALYKNQQEKYIKAHLEPSFCCLSFPETFNRARRNSVDLFQDIIDLEIADVVQIENDRSFYFKLSHGFQMLFKMHGNRSNIVLIQGDKVLGLFRNNLKQDSSIDVTNISNHITSNVEAFEEANGNYKKLIPTFGKAFDAYFEQKGYAQLEMEQKYSCFIDLLRYLEKPAFYINEKEGKLPQLSVYKLDESDQGFDIPTEAVNTFYKKYITSFKLNKEKSILQNALLAQIKKSHAYINVCTSKLQKLKSASNYQMIGDLIMANLYTIPPHASEVILKDFYTQKPIKIHLKSMLSPQHNAEKYYRKAKKQQIEIDILRKNIATKEGQVKEWQVRLEEIYQISMIRQLDKKAKQAPKKAEPPYHTVNFSGYEIMVGKNAAKNEILTFKVAKKEDLFLHAKDSPGSHVIIKKKSNQNIPQNVIEKAASFAAFYSKKKSESLCRVLYTPRKYVRKAKGAPAAAVIVEREKVVLVSPEKIDN